jgi:hypothetical protein
MALIFSGAGCASGGGAAGALRSGVEIVTLWPLVLFPVIKARNS